jgi:hypothetical protein
MSILLFLTLLTAFVFPSFSYATPWKNSTEIFSKSPENIFDKMTKAFDDLRKPDWQRFLESPVGIIIVIGVLIIIILLVVRRR